MAAGYVGVGPSLVDEGEAGFAILKHMHELSDEVLCGRWIENPYYQLFCGEEFFRHELPLDHSSLTRWRQRMGECCPSGCENARALSRVVNATCAWLPRAQVLRLMARP
jgi:hypothetical protein